MSIADELAELLRKIEKEQLAAPDLATQVALARAENAALKAAGETRVSLRVSDKGAVSVYGLRWFPVTLYKDQWLKLLDAGHEIKAFIRANQGRLRKY